MTTAEVPGASAAVPPSSPPTKASLTNWWERFKKRSGKDNGGIRVRSLIHFHPLNTPGIFGVPLHRSINYANVAISLTDANGQQFVYGYVPIVVAKCGVFLKEKATDVEGIFRLSGSAKRIKDLQSIFDSPEKYGKGLDWTGYTVHDAANVLRRYLNLLPEPIIPLEFYNRFRDPLTVQLEKFNAAEAIKIYQRLISELPPLNRQLLLYILDLLAVFASKSELNRMNAENLAAIFQPGLISHPSHEMAPQAYKLSQDVLVFLINHQDHFLLGMRGTNDDEGGPELNTPSTPSSAKHLIARSPSNSSAGADDVRRYGNIRRNASVSSKKSGGHAPTKSGGVSRSNTLPSKRSPHTRASTSFRPTDGSSSPRPNESTATTESTATVQPPSPGGKMMENVSPVGAPNPAGLGLQPMGGARSRQVSRSSPQMSPVTMPNKDLFYNIFTGDSEKPQRKLRKKRIPGSSNHSAESSTTSLPNNTVSLSHPPLETVSASPPPAPPAPAAPTASTAPALAQSQPLPVPTSKSSTSGATSTSTLMPTMSPTPSATSSVTSQDSAHSYSDATNTSTSPEKKKKAKSRWRWSNSKVEGWNPGSPPFGGSTGSIAERMRRASPSPPDPDRKVSSDGSGDDERSNKGPRGWLKKLSERKYPLDDNIQVQQLPPPQYPAPALPQVQPPTPSSLGKPISPIAEVENSINEAHSARSDVIRDPDTPTPTQTNTNILGSQKISVPVDFTPKSPPTVSEGSPGTSPESETTPRASSQPSPEARTGDAFMNLPSISNDNASSPLPNGTNGSTAEPINADLVPGTAR
ncbi:hypothetical protein BDD12DRAFT_871755 [Trichophaea hybrida]|nr:hypothetical protein BDD12DRAFT_871755 [Trichophaea hybrida]